MDIEEEKLDNDEIKLRKETTLAKFKNYLDKEFKKGNSKRVSLLSYWLNTYTDYLDWEKDFQPQKMKRYKRGEIIKVNFGFNVGSELGGLHYAVVLSNNDTLYSPVLTVIPLCSKKENKDKHVYMIDLGTDVYDLLNSKIENLKIVINNMFTTKEAIQNASKEGIDELVAKLKDLDQMFREIKRMKSGSYALVNQVTTISKMRIYNPKNSSDSLANIKLSPEKLDLINESIIKTIVYKNIDEK